MATIRRSAQIECIRIRSFMPQQLLVAQLFNPLPVSAPLLGPQASSLQTPLQRSSCLVFYIRQLHKLSLSLCCIFTVTKRQ
jgi:hypothetical protein